MGNQAAVRVAWVVLGVSVGLAVAAVGLGFARGPVAGVPDFTSASLLIYLAFLAWVAVGVLIVAGRPHNRIGWILCAAGLLVLVGCFAAEYAVSALLAGWSLPAGRAMAWLAPWTTVLGLCLFFYLLPCSRTATRPAPVGGG